MQAGRARYIMIFINPAFTQMIGGTENPKSLRSSQGAARYNEFRCNIEGILKIAPFPWPPKV